MDRINDQRKAALAARRTLTPKQRYKASLAACRRLARLPAVRRAQTVGLYWPLASEIDPRPLMPYLTPAARCFVPRVAGHTLRFVQWHAHLRWRRSPLGVQEPLGAAAHQPAVLDVLIMPLAGFDAQAHRIGLGGGYYDRSLASLRDHDYRSPCRIGLAFDCQRLAHITPAPWDIELAAVVSERQVYRRAAGQLR